MVFKLDVFYALWTFLKRRKEVPTTDRGKSGLSSPFCRLRRLRRRRRKRARKYVARARRGGLRTEEGRNKMDGRTDGRTTRKTRLLHNQSFPQGSVLAAVSETHRSVIVLPK